MPETPIYGFSYETPQSKPGITLTGDIDGSSPILAEQVENVAAAFDSRLTAVETSGYRYLTTVLFTANGTFTKGSYSGFRALRARGVGGGGQCGGVAATGVGQAAEGGAGGGSGYAESFLVDASVPSSITVTIGAGGSSGGAGANGPDGGTTTFGAILSITGGGGGIAMAGTTGNLVAGGGGSGRGAGGNSFNIAQPVQGQTNDVKLEQENGMLHVKCDVHRWMTEYVGVVEHPYFAVSDANGAFTIRGVPPGDHTVVAWHEKLGSIEQKVGVKGGATAPVELTYPAAKL